MREINSYYYVYLLSVLCCRSSGMYVDFSDMHWEYSYKKRNIQIFGNLSGIFLQHIFYSYKFGIFLEFYNSINI